jgi:hypothetical protein
MYAAFEIINIVGQINYSPETNKKCRDRNTPTGTRITTESIVDYIAI